MLGKFVDARGNTYKFSAEEARRRGLRAYTDDDRAREQASAEARAAGRRARVGSPDSKMIAGAENKGS